MCLFHAYSVVDFININKHILITASGYEHAYDASQYFL
ncbi:Putative uncharacterized protein [Moritella viscosa]|uniref:Uncharacterized protein n=1 Tax=Moritella viscosa TaxID=80854 RepID=A0ABY1HGT1_9GAMM|nr:Putative uncharacterized protein [Moritella viscosa]SGY98522.1 Putative uncharacterized protein [Moritella viscosa]SGZ05093.1 Putative uncharacterized protein [Moritella viscosa]SHO26710.1 Putative uncharacterized protein [Moritella viscosa]